LFAHPAVVGVYTCGAVKEGNKQTDFVRIAVGHVHIYHDEDVQSVDDAV
jgi:hypothetical protein